MPKITINDADVQRLKTPLYKKDGNIIYLLLPLTSADQVEFTNGKNAETIVTELNTSISAAQATANQGVSDAAAAMTKATNAQTTASAAQSTANTANSMAEAAASSASSAATTASTALSTANSAKTLAEAAQSTAASANTTASAAQTTANSIASTANAALASAESAETTANSASSTAAAAQTTANSAKTLAESALPLDGSKPMTAFIQRSTNIDHSNIPASNEQEYFAIIRDSSNSNIGSYSVSHDNDGNSLTQMGAIRLVNGVQKSASMGTGFDADGNPYAMCQHPRGLYNSDITTQKSVMDYGARRMTAQVNIWAGGSNGSDTSGLFDDRGFSASKPFLTPLAAIKWITSVYSGNQSVHLKLTGNLELKDYNIIAQNLYALVIESADPANPATLTIKDVGCVGGALYFANLSLQIASGAQYAFKASGYYHRGTIILGNGLSLNGAVSKAVLQLSYGGQISLAQLSGNVSGSAYEINTFGYLSCSGKAATTLIPGSSAGSASDKAIIL